MYVHTVKPHYNVPLETAEKVQYIRVFTISGCSLYQGVHYIRVFTTSGCSLHQGIHYIRVFTTSGFIYIEQIGVHSKVYVCYIRESTVSRVHYSEVRLYVRTVKLG